MCVCVSVCSTNEKLHLVSAQCLCYCHLSSVHGRGYVASTLIKIKSMTLYIVPYVHNAHCVNCSLYKFQLSIWDFKLHSI